MVLREAVAAGEPLNAEIVEHVRQAWGVTVRDGWGQTEATVQIANPPGFPVRAGQLGRVLPGCRVAVMDDEDVSRAKANSFCHLNHARRA